MSRIDDKIHEIEKYLEELESILPSTFKDYQKNFEKKAACERYFEKVIEAVVDLAFLIVKNSKFKIPEEDKGVFDILSRESVISQKIAKKLKDAKGMRNIIAHEYGEIDDSLVFEAITEELISDVKEFMRLLNEK